MKNNRILALLLALVMLLRIAMPAFATESEAGADSTESTESTQPEEIFETIYIQNADDLLEFSRNCRLDTWSVGKLVVLQANISLEGTDFQPIPSFGGIFDGNGHTISGLHITENVTPAGLFGELQVTGIIRDLTVSGTVIPGGDALAVGGIVGENHGTITDCTFTGSIVGSANTGGIAGVNDLTGKIAGCEVSGTVIGSDMTGGIAGCNLGIIGSSVNKAYVNTISVDPTINPEDINFDFLTDYSKLTSLDTSTAAMDTGGIAGYSSGIIESCTNKAAIGYPHIGYNVGGIAGRSCGYIHNCENTAEIFGRKDVGGIAGQMEPYIAKNLTESAIAKLQRQLDELDVLLDQAMSHADGAADSVVKRLNGIAGAAGAAGNAAQDIKTTGTITGNVSGSGESSGDGSVTVTPPQMEAGGDAGTGGSVNVEVSPGSGSIDIQTGTGGEVHAGLTEGGISGEGNTSGNGTVVAETQISISTNLGGIASALYGLSGQMSMLGGELEGASDELMADVELIRAKIDEITETGFALILGDGEDDVIIDSSELNIDLITLGKVSYCTNSGRVNGDINVGGITGDMGMEYALDPEDDVTISIDGSTRRKYEVKAVVQHCENTGTVIAKRNYAGGIAGKMDLGLIAQCESYGSVSSESGNYVGGIAGLGGSTIRHCFSKCSLSGGKYIGGIVGSGVEEDRNGESSTVAACYAIVTITDYKQYAGAISGAYAGTFLENYFVSEDLAGINRMSYAGCAEPVTYDKLIDLFTQTEETNPKETEPADETEASEEAQTEETTQIQPVIVVPPMELPDEFKKFTLKFVIDGEIVYTDIFDYGASFEADVFPEIPKKDGYYGYWDRTELNDLKFDTTVTAVYEPYISALESGNMRNGNRAVFFVEGNFADEDALTVTSLALTSSEFDLVDGVWDAVVKSLANGKLNAEVVEQWQLLLPADGLTEHTVRYLPPDGNADNMDVYVLTDGKWVKTETKVIGSYVTFPAAGNDVQIAVVSSVQTWWVWLIAAALILILLVLTIRLVRKFVKLKPKAVAAPAEKAEPSARMPGAHKPWLTILLVILALLVGIGGTAAFFLLPDLMADLSAYEILKACSEKEELSMELQAEAVIGEKDYPITATLDRTMLDSKRVTVISESGRSLCYCDGAVFLENGDAYRIGTAFPDHSLLLEQTMALYKYVDIEEEDGVYSITAANSDAKAILELLIPSAATLLSDTDSLKVNLITDDGELEKIEFIGSGTLNDSEKNAYSVNAELKIVGTSPTVQIPETVAEAILSGEYETREALSDDLYRLANGWQNLNGADPLATDLTLSADCGPLILNESLQLYRWRNGENDIFCVQENGYALYFTDDAVCDSKGNSIPTASAANVEAAHLLDIAYDICMNASADCVNQGEQYTYTLSLDDEGMEAVAYAIAPEAEKLNISFESGSIRVVIADERIDSVEIAVSGSVQIVLSTADVSIGAKLEFSGNSVDVTIPGAVKEALQK